MRLSKLGFVTVLRLKATCLLVSKKCCNICVLSAFAFIVLSGCRSNSSIEGYWYGVIEQTNGRTDGINLCIAADTLKMWNGIGFSRLFPCTLEKGQLLVGLKDGADTMFRVKWINDSTVRLNEVDFWRLEGGALDFIPSVPLNDYCLDVSSNTFHHAISIPLFQTDSGTVALLNDRVASIEDLWDFMPYDHSPKSNSSQWTVAIHMGSGVPLISLAHVLAIAEYFAVDSVFVLTKDHAWDNYCQTVLPKSPLAWVDRTMLEECSTVPIPPPSFTDLNICIGQLDFDASMLDEKTFQDLTSGSKPFAFLFDGSESVDDFLALCGIISEYRSGLHSIHFTSSMD